MNELIDNLLMLIKEAKYPVVLTGAGMSTESGVPDFRSESGWWRKMDPTTVATIDALETNYQVFREFYKHRILALAPCKPNRGHEILADWEAKGIIKCVITQNIDGFHREAGNKEVYELHGALNKITCYTCGKEHEKSDFLDNNSCSVCNGKLRPGVVLFGEMLPAVAWDKAYKEIEKSDLIIVLGTSLNVSPVNRLPFVTKGKKVLINLDKTCFDDEFDLVINDKVGKVLLSLHQHREDSSGL